MALDDIFGDALKHYVVATTSAESALLTQLREDTLQKSPVARMLCGPVEGKLLQLLIKISGAKRCLELGTFTGYSALQIAEALPEGGTLITCENNQKHADIAQKYFNLSPYGFKITLTLGDALETLSTLDTIFDFIFIDANKANYPHYYDALMPKLKSGGIMVVDNALRNGDVVAPNDNRAKAIDALNQKARHDPLVETLMLTVRDGILVVRKI